MTHTERAYWSCESDEECGPEDCYAGRVCDECTNEQDRPVWWPCAVAWRPVSDHATTSDEARQYVAPHAPRLWREAGGIGAQDAVIVVPAWLSHLTNGPVAATLLGMPAIAGPVVEPMVIRR
jgi:hypothetical protein